MGNWETLVAAVAVWGALLVAGCGGGGDKYLGDCAAEITGDNNEVNQNCNSAGGDASQDNSDDHSSTETTNEAPAEGAHG